MTVTFLGAKTLGNLLPGFSDAISQAQEFLTGDPENKSIRDGLLGDLLVQQEVFDARFKEVEAKVTEMRALINKAEEINKSLQATVDKYAGGLSTAGVYTFSITNQLAGNLPSELSVAMSTSGISSEAVLAGTLVVASDGAAISAVQSLFKVFD